MKKFVWLSLGFLIFAGISMGDQGGVTGAIVPENTVSNFIYVNNLSAQASDTNPGTNASLPLLTISKAAKIATANNTNNIGTKIIIYPGIYREAVQMWASAKSTTAPMIFEAESTNATVISGSDIWTNWQQSANLYTHAWTNTWGLTAIPNNWPTNLPDIIRRREIFFINGNLVTQVLSLAAMQTNTFFVDDTNAAIVYIWPPNGISLSNTSTNVVEAGQRSTLFWAQGMGCVVLRGLTFIHNAAVCWGNSGGFLYCTNALIDSCDFFWNNGGGSLGFARCYDVTQSNCVARYNGGNGCSCGPNNNVLFVDNDFSYNNWRGAMGGWYGWSQAGCKCGNIHNGVFRRQSAVGNQSRGWWFDTDHTNILVDSCFFSENLLVGIDIEACPGPIVLTNSVFCYNQTGQGIRGECSENIIINNNTIYGNGGMWTNAGGMSEVGAASVPRWVVNWETGVSNLSTAVSWALADNIIVATDARQYLVGIGTATGAESQAFFSTFAFNRNHMWYDNPVNSNVFVANGHFANFTTWGTNTGVSADSTCLPMTSITSPANNAAIVATNGTCITIMASSVDSDGGSDGGTISNVTFYQGTTLLGCVTSGPSPYSMVWSNVTAGSYVLKAVTLDAYVPADSRTSAPVNVRVWSVNPAGNISTVSPASGSYTGGYQVVITGTSLGNGSDITNVTLCGFTVASIGKQSATQVVVKAGAGTGGIGDVTVCSVSYGATIKSSAFWYSVPPQNVSATDGSYTNIVRVTWSASPGATGYEVWRSLINSSVTAGQIGNASSLVYDDATTASGVMNYYWVIATNGYGISSFSSSASGWRQSYAPGVVAFDAASYAVNEDAGSVTLSVTRSGGNYGAASVNYSTQDGTAIAGVDYVATSGTLSWADGDSAGKTITVSVINRPGKQDDRVFTVGLSGAWSVAIVSPSSPSVTIRDMSPPSPSWVTASKGSYSNEVLVGWNYVPALFSASYKVWRGTDTNAQNAALLATTTASTYFDTTATPDVSYHYWVQAVNTAGVSAFSVPDSGYCGTIANLTSPTGVQASKGNTDRITVAWQAVSKAAYYEVWRNTGNDLSGASLVGRPAGTSYDDYSVSQGACYYYWVKARTAQRDGDFSGSVAGWRLLSAPGGMRASDGTYPYHIQVAWNAVEGAISYDVWRKDIPGGSNGVNLIQVAQTGGLAFNDYQAKSGAYYGYEVKARNALCSSLDYGQSTGRRQVNATPTSLSAMNDYDGDKMSDLALFNPSSGVLDILCSKLGQQTVALGVGRNQGVTGDYDGDRVADPVAYSPDSGAWLIRLSSMNYNPIIRGSFGGNGANPVAADFDGDGLTDIGTYDEGKGVLSIIFSHKGAFDVRASGAMGGPGYGFVSADFDGDKLADPTAYSESEGRVTILFSGIGYFPVNVALGGQGKAMYAADFDGDKLADPVLYEEATGTWAVSLSSAGYRAARISFGGPGYVPVIADYDGDGLADPAVYRETDGQWLIMFSTSNYSVITETFGGSGYQSMAK